MQFSTDERHAQTLAMLAEVRDYIASWPSHPMNRDMLARIDAHVDDPVHQLVLKSDVERTGASFTPGGLCLIRASLKGHTVNVSIPAKPKCADDAAIIKALHHGISLELKPKA